MTAPPGETGAPVTLDRQVGRSAFGGDADGYHTSRSGYPAELFECLAQRTVTHPRVLEIGAGTGLASAGLLDLRPASLTLLEPDPRLCAFLEHRFSADAAQVACGVFPDVELARPFDLVACAAAFHWMEPGPALASIRSLLTPGGIWAMWWNTYFGLGMDNTFAERLVEELVEEGIRLPPSYAGLTHYSLDTDRHIRMLCEAGFDDVDQVVIRTERGYDARQACDLIASFSFFNTLAARQQTHLLKRIRSLVEDEFHGFAQGMVITSLYCAST